MQMEDSGIRHIDVGAHRVFSRERTRGAPPAGPSVVLVHGYVISGRYMLPLMDELAPHYRVYVPDLPGWGKSSKPAHALPLAQLADVLAAWVEILGLVRPVFLGNSFGCQIVAELAVRHADLPSALILLGPTVDPTAQNLWQQAVRLALDAPHERLSLWALELEDLVRMGLPRAAETVRIMVGDRIEDKLPKITVPTLVMRGSRDPIAPQRWGEEASRLLPYGTLAVIAGAPHAANFSTPELVTEAAVPFIREASMSSM
ncbi:MAG: hypothetical protein NVS2B16_26190 [Chloroflexota bacterium]